MRRRRIVFSDQMYADTQLLKTRIVQGCNLQAAILTLDEDVSGGVVRSRRAYGIQLRRHAHDYIAQTRAQRILQKRFSLSPPRILDLRVHIVGEEFRQPILDSLASLVRKRQIIGIRAHAQLSLLRSEQWETEQQDGATA